MLRCEAVKGLKCEEKYLEVDVCPDKQPMQSVHYWCNMTKPRRITYEAQQKHSELSGFSQAGCLATHTIGYFNNRCGTL